MDVNQRRSSLLFHLGQAHSKITSLEDYIREREKQFRSVVTRFERSDSRSMVAGGRLRRVGLSHNLLHMRTSTSQEEEEQEECESGHGYYTMVWSPPTGLMRWAVPLPASCTSPTCIDPSEKAEGFGDCPITALVS